MYAHVSPVFRQFTNNSDVCESCGKNRAYHGWRRCSGIYLVLQDICVQNQTYSVASVTAVTGSILCGNRELAIIGHNKVVLNIVSISQRFSHRKPENTDPINRKFEQNFEKCLCFITRGSTVQFISQKMGGSKYFLLYGNQMKKSLMGVHLFVPKWNDGKPTLWRTGGLGLSPALSPLSKVLMRKVFCWLSRMTSARRSSDVMQSVADLIAAAWTKQNSQCWKEAVWWDW